MKLRNVMKPLIVSVAISLTSTYIYANIQSVDVNKVSEHSGKTLSDIYGSQPDTDSIMNDNIIYNNDYDSNLKINEDVNSMLNEGKLNKIRDGLYESEDGTLYIDAQVNTEHTGKTLSEVYGEQPSLRGSSMPNSTWSWNNGNYSGDFTINHMYVYTNYFFTGYSTLYTDTIAQRNIWTGASDNYTVYLMTGSGQGTIRSSSAINSTRWTSVRWYNLDPGTRYAFAIGKANDGSTLSGTISVSR